jgi:adenylate cyclase
VQDDSRQQALHDEEQIAAVRAQLARLLDASDLRRSPRMQRLLRHIVEATLAGDGERLKGYTLAVEVYDRGADFDPNLDPIVRIEAGRLRAKLLAYYSAEGASDAVRIDVPKGSYKARFAFARTHPGPVQANSQQAALLPGPLTQAIAAAPSLQPPRDTRPTHNLPAPLDSLIGRDADLVELSRWLDKHRIVTVIGAGGIGKTRLAQAVARSQLDRYAQGVWWVDLAALRSPADIVAAVASAAQLQLGVGDSGAQLARALAARETLLVLDNCEHLAAPVATIAQEVVAAAPAVRLLATSQQPLHIGGEHLYRLETLAVPARGTKLSEARGFSALALLEQRACAVDRDFELTESTMASAIELCHELDGIALAIEMAAARSPTFGIAAMRSQIARLRTAHRSVPTRQRTLRATLEWSHDLLDANEQAVLRRLAVFVGRFRLDAAQFVAAQGLDASGVTEALSGLVDKSLVQIERAEPPRYRLLETMRTYASERLCAAGEEEDALQRHGLAMLALAEESDRNLFDIPVRQWQQRYEVHYGDLQAAFDRACSRRNPEVAGATGELLWRLDDRRGLLAPPRRRTHAAYALLADAGPLAQARLWNCIATWSGMASAPVPAIEAARQRALAWHRVGHPWQRYWAVSRLAAALARSGKLQAAEEVLAELHEIEDPSWPLRQRFHTRWVRSMLFLYRGDAAALESSARAEQAMAEQAGSERAMAMAMANLTKAALLAGDGAKAVARGREAVQAARVSEVATNLIYALDDLCTALLLANDVACAVSTAMEALPLMVDNDYSGFLFDALSLLAVRTAKPETAAILSGCADAWYGTIKAVRTPIDVRTAALAKAEIDSALGPQQCEQLRAQGARLPLGEAEALAHRLLTPCGAEPTRSPQGALQQLKAADPALFAENVPTASETGLKHRLAAILAADAAGYSRLMAADERGTVAALDAARLVFRRLVEANQGRIIDMAGDSVLAVFDTATGAVSAALAVQGDMAADGGVPQDRQLRFRIGVHLGDIFEKSDGTVYGNGVNIAARLQSLAESGGITASDAIESAVRGRLTAHFVDQGEHRAKNIPHPLHAFAVRPGDDEVAPTCAPVPALRPPSDRPSIAVLPFTYMERSVGGPSFRPLPDIRPAHNLPAIAVLPFDNLGDDPRQDYFCSGLTDDLTACLSSFPDLFIIGRHSAAACKVRLVDAESIGRELGVSYLLEGSVRADGGRIRVNARLVDAHSGRQLWAERYDRERAGVFAVQDDLTRRIIGTLVARVTRSELSRAMHKRPEALAAYDYFLRGREAVRRVAQYDGTEHSNEARRWLNLSIAADPHYGRPLAWLAWTYFQTWLEPSTDELLRCEYMQKATLDRALALAQQAVDLDPFSSEIRSMLGLLLHWAQRRSEGMREFERAFELNSNVAEWRMVIVAFTHNGRSDEAIELMKQIKRADPFYPRVYDMQVAQAYYLTGDFGTALDLLRVAVRAMPSNSTAHVWHAAAAAQVGDAEEARAAAAQATRLIPEFSIRRFVGLRLALAKDIERLSDGLRRAGLPD